VALLAVLLGIAVSTQIHQTREQGLESLRQEELVAVLDTVTQRSGRLDDEIAQLTLERQRLEQSVGGPAAEAAAQARVDALAILAGTVRATGPGVQIVITDTRHTVGAATLVDAIQELRDAGTEAMQIGSVRVVASSYVTEDAQGGVAVDGVALPSPFTILAIGDPQTLASAMDIPGGVVATIRGVGATVAVTQVRTVRVDSLHAPAAPRYARPEPSPTGSTPASG
ncbi:MAG: DUF881 domain-containing protein, partial [Micrococcales bacterium]|nr:DUF881 domain-containing protein [Micrococcales bacterium]